MISLRTSLIIVCGVLATGTIISLTILLANMHVAAKLAARTESSSLELPWVSTGFKFKRCDDSNTTLHFFQISACPVTAILHECAFRPDSRPTFIVDFTPVIDYEAAHFHYVLSKFGAVIDLCDKGVVCPGYRGQRRRAVINVELEKRIFPNRNPRAEVHLSWGLSSALALCVEIPALISSV